MASEYRAIQPSHGPWPLSKDDLDLDSLVSRFHEEETGPLERKGVLLQRKRKAEKKGSNRKKLFRAFLPSLGAYFAAQNWVARNTQTDTTGGAGTWALNFHPHKTSCPRLSDPKQISSGLQSSKMQTMRGILDLFPKQAERPDRTTRRGDGGGHSVAGHQTEPHAHH